MVQFIYALLSIIVIVLVIVFGVGWRSNYVPHETEKSQNKRGKGGESDVSTD